MLLEPHCLYLFCFNVFCFVHPWKRALYVTFNKISYRYSLCLSLSLVFCLFLCLSVCLSFSLVTSNWSLSVPADSSSRGGDIAVHVFDINQPSLPTPFYSVLVIIPVFTTLSIVFHSINSLDNCPLSHSVLLVLFLACWSFQLSLWKPPIALNLI